MSSKLLKAFQKNAENYPTSIDEIIINFLKEDNEIYFLNKIENMKMNGLKYNISPILYLYNHGDPSKISERLKIIENHSIKQNDVLDLALYRIRACGFIKSFLGDTSSRKHYSWCPYLEWIDKYDIQK